MISIKPRLAAFAGSLIVAASIGAPAHSQDAPAPVTAEEAHSIGVDAYLYLYPLITMEITRKQLTNSDAFGRGPMNEFHNIPAYPPATDTSVVRTNYDTLYSIAYLDLSNEPMVVSAPDTNGRYLHAPDARHVDGCVRLAGFAHDGD